MSEYSVRRAIRYSASWTERLDEEQFAYLLILPAFLLVGAMAFWPLVRTFELSLHADNLFGGGYVGEFVGVENYVELLTGERDSILGNPFLSLSQPFSSAIIVTLIFTVVSVGFETIIGFGQALVLDQDFRGRRWVRVAIIIPWAVPIAIQGMIFYLLFQPGIGFGTSLMQDLGVFTATPLINSVDSMIILIVADIWKASAFMALLILAGLQSVDRTLYKVGRVSGASRWQMFWMITFPLVLPTLMVAMLFRTIQAMRVFGTVETITSCSTVPTLTCLVVDTFSSGRYGTSAAVAFITAVIVGLVATVYIVWFSDVS
ncbi:carbohydrate ABC transporter permease [Haladaptatus cibarius]|uniref:carbohydrate ABC transporter permease n=1 Tax=Haladaptatus cibarius TaxID=453847 RepID=UPI000678ED10|nr:sugar ABC transporter permease [Haladaptatus cibarius]